MTARPMNPASNLVWIDLEMTGLDTDRDLILEIATIVTDCDLNEVAVGPELAIRQEEQALDGMDSWNRRHHGESGLLDRVRASEVNEAEAERLTLEFLQQHVAAGESPMCGNSICQDRRFLHRCMPRLEKYFHYRHIDVSTLKELYSRWRGKPDWSKGGAHRALADIRDSIEELRYYRDNFLRAKEGK